MKKTYYLFSGIIILTLFVFLSLRVYKGDYYKLSLEDTHAILMNADINISTEELNAAGSDILKLDVVRGMAGTEIFREEENQITVPTSNLLDHKLLKRLESHKGIVAIISEDPGLAAKSWLILTRKGIENVEIISSKGNEIISYTFKPERK